MEQQKLKHPLFWFDLNRILNLATYFLVTAKYSVFLDLFHDPDLRDTQSVSKQQPLLGIQNTQKYLQTLLACVSSVSKPVDCSKFVPYLTSAPVQLFLQAKFHSSECIARYQHSAFCKPACSVSVYLLRITFTIISRDNSR
jgi:hypothetical protein